MGQDIVQKTKDFFESDPSTRLALLFGSQVTGRAHAGSDVDVAVYYPAPLSLDERVDKAQALSAILNTEVDLIDLREAHGVLLQQILAHRITLVNRDAELYGNIIAKRLNEESDFMPLYELVVKAQRERFLNGKRVISQKLDNLRNCVRRIESKVPSDPETLAADYDIQDIISVNLERAIQSSLDAAAHIGADFDDMSMLSAASIFLELAKHKVISTELAESLARAAGFRNLLVHRYAAIDWKRVHTFITTQLDIFRSFVAQVEAYAA